MISIMILRAELNMDSPSFAIFGSEVQLTGFAVFSRAFKYSLCGVSEEVPFIGGGGEIECMVSFFNTGAD